MTARSDISQSPGGDRARMVGIVRLLAVAAIVACSACSQATLRHVNRAGAVAMVISLAADGCQTRGAAADGWSRGRTEGGMPTSWLIGSTPSTGAVDAYFAVGTVALLGAAQLVPERYRPYAYAAVIGLEAVTVHGNLESTNCMGVGR